MISALTGQLRQVQEGHVQLQVGPILYELLVPAADASELQVSLGDEITFHTILYLEGDPSRGNLEPRLIGFLRQDDRKFFNLFTMVKGIGPKTALRALTVPVGQIAQAIETKDARFLVRLKGIGKRTAELIIAELSGKMSDFAVGYEQQPAFASARRPAFEEDALEGLMALGEPRVLAERLIERARQINPDLQTSDALLREMLRLRTTRA